MHAADVAVVNDNTDVQVISDNQLPKRWPSSESLVVAYFGDRDWPFRDIVTAAWRAVLSAEILMHAVTMMCLFPAFSVSSDIVTA